MKVLILLLAVASNTYSIAFAMESQTPAQHMMQSIDVADVWRFACKITETECKDPPKVIVAPLFREHGAFGVYFPTDEGYFPSDSVVIDSDLLPFMDKVYEQAVLAHEMTHYIDHVYKGLSLEDGCQTEWNGWRTMNAYLVSHGRADAADYNWQQRYGCFGAAEEGE